MSVGGNFPSWYDRADTIQQLQSAGCDQAKIDRVLAQLDIGNVGILDTENLTGKVDVKQLRPFLPTPGKYDKESFQNVMFKLETFDFLAAMELLFEVSKQVRETNRDLRHGDRDLAYAANMNAAQEIREAAKQEFWASIVSGVTNIISGSVGIVSTGFFGEVGAAVGKAVGQVGGGLAEGGAAWFKLDAAGHKGAQAEFNAEAQKLQSKESESADYQKAAAELIQHVITMLREITQNQLAVDQHIFQNM